MSSTVSPSKHTSSALVSMPDIINARICGFIGESGRDRPALRSTCKLFNQVIGSSSFNALEKSLKTQPIHYLHWTQRPNDVQSAINRAFNRLATRSNSEWSACNGSPGYYMAQVDEMAVIRNIIKKAPKTRTDFFVLDIGAGNFQWGRKVAKEMQDTLFTRKDATLHIYGIRGERHYRTEPIKEGQCIRYELGNFKIEEIAQEFGKHQIKDNCFDLVISRWAFRHFADPVATWAQTYNMLRALGFFIFDGFFFNTQEDDNFESYLKTLRPNMYMMNLVKDSGAPFLMMQHNYMRSLNHFILQKPNSLPCHLPMSYISVIYEEVLEYCQVGSRAATKFHRPYSPFNLFWPDENVLSGNGDLYRSLKESDALEKNSSQQVTLWEPGYFEHCMSLRKRFCDAIFQANQKLLSQILSKGFNINYAIERHVDWLTTSNETRYISPIRLAIQNKNYQAFKSLLEAGAHIHFYTISKKEGSAIEEAIATDKSGEFLQLLLDHPDAESYFEKSLNEKPKSAFSLAIKLQNTNAIALIKAYQQKNTLQKHTT